MFLSMVIAFTSPSIIFTSFAISSIARGSVNRVQGAASSAFSSSAAAAVLFFSNLGLVASLVVSQRFGDLRRRRWKQLDLGRRLRRAPAESAGGARDGGKIQIGLLWRRRAKPDRGAFSAERVGSIELEFGRGWSSQKAARWRLLQG